MRDAPVDSGPTQGPLGPGPGPGVRTSPSRPMGRPAPISGSNLNFLKAKLKLPPLARCQWPAVAWPRRAAGSERHVQKYLAGASKTSAPSWRESQVRSDAGQCQWALPRPGPQAKRQTTRRLIHRFRAGRAPGSCATRLRPSREACRARRGLSAGAAQHKTSSDKSPRRSPRRPRSGLPNGGSVSSAAAPRGRFPSGHQALRAPSLGGVAHCRRA